ncbi:DUF368 domain-containing protein [Alkalihalobacillus hemicellulosilyticus]|uniref:Integral membrane protein n=1 Tax=Halalkalibacter hemicellulosilyticusJCM 9152 TaxID=1236971 RepID=W4QFR2_9BACI|nr:DUF368 domain-containing protein [Halalkalibacter hemicellulosilyticus]GAE30483.1 hypothetical protein JCM9152_1891 [Halalkalibacter hemicellulosilyticusJCM 9152]
MVKLILRGMAVGMTETVPGISGSTVAMIVGIYERLIYSLSILTTNKRKEAIPFLLTFGVGMVLGFGCSIFIIKFLLETYRTPTFLFFVGIIVGFLPYLWHDTIKHAQSKLRVKHYVIMLFFFGVVVGSQVLGSFHFIDWNHLTFFDYVFFIIAGFIASTALVLPGISGALILTILGLYEAMTASLVALNWPILFAVGSGILLGVLLTSKLIRYLLKHYTSETYSAMVGLVSGSIFAILNELDGVINNQVIIASLITFVGGIVLIFLLQQTQKKL